jgi:hypothetical protein
MREKTLLATILAVVLISMPTLSSSIQLAAASASPPKLYGIVGNHLVTVNQTTGDATDVGIINATGLIGLTYDPYRDALYSVANATTDPKLIVIDQTTAQVTLVGPIDLEGYDPTFLTFVEALAFNPNGSTLYGSAGSAPPYSNRLIRIDPATGNATQIASITGTTENDGDTLVFINGTLYLSDSTPGSDLFTVNLSNGAATYVGGIGFSNVKLAYNSETQTVFGAATLDRLLVKILPSTGQGTLVGTTHSPEGFEGGFMSAIAVVSGQVIPEFPSAVMLAALITITLAVSLAFRRKARP